MTDLRVLHVIPRLGPGGAERVLFTMIRELARIGVRSDLCVLGDENAFPERLRGLVEPRFLGYRGSRRDVLGKRRCVGRLRQLARGLEVDLVHAHLWLAAEIAGLACRGGDVPLLVHVHDTRPWIVGNDWRSRLGRVQMRRSLSAVRPYYVAVSEAAGRYTTDHLRWVPRPMEVVHNGYDGEAFAVITRNSKPQPSGDVVVGVAGRLAPEKGHEFAIRAAAELRDRGVQVQLRIAGEGSSGEGYRRLIHELGLGDRVQLLGGLADMYPFYRDLEVFVLPSIGAEGLPMVVLEAMAQNVAVIATNLAGVPEAIRDGREGLLVAPGDAQALADAIQRLVLDSDLRRQLAQAGAERVRECFTGQKMAQQLQRIYARLLSEPSTAGSQDAPIPDVTTAQ